jgi:hypothetical protein
LHYRATPSPKYHVNTDPHKFLKCYEAAIASTGGDEATLAKPLIISLEDAATNPVKMHLFLAIVKREVPTQFPRVPSGARQGRRLIVMCSKRKRNATQFLPKVLDAECSSSGSI